jgi:hypothetical protein
LVNVLKNDCGISEPFDPTTGGPSPTVHVFSAIWDTGATNTVITENVAKQCGLAPTGMTLVQTAHGSKQANTYLVSVYLPANVHFRA